MWDSSFLSTACARRSSSPTEQRTLEILLALAVSSEVRELANSPHGGSSLEQIDELVYGHPSVRDRFSEDLAPDGGLLGYRSSPSTRLVEQSLIHAQAHTTR